MNKPVQTAIQSRDGAVQAEEPVPPMFPWAPRTDDKRALLVSERATVFDRPSPALVPDDPAAAISDPVWDHCAFTRWTPDLVHCRLLVAGEIVGRMPPVLRKGYVSQLGNMALSEMSASHRIAPSPMEISLADWTLWEIAARQWRNILLAAAFDISFEKIAATLKAAGQDLGKSTVHRRYVTERRFLAARWRSARQPIDRASAEKWNKLFQNRRK